MSCSEKEDKNKIAILKETQDELIHQCKMQENQLRIKFQGNPSSEVYFTISQKLNSYIFSLLDTINTRNNTHNLKLIQVDYFNILSKEKKNYKFKLFLPQDDSAIYSLRFDLLKQVPDKNTEHDLLNNITILNNHLKILQMNGICAAPGCILGVRHLGYGSTNVYEDKDSSTIFSNFIFTRNKTVIKHLKFINLENENGITIHPIKTTNLPGDIMRVSTKKLKKGKYNLTITFETIIESGEEKTENIRFPIEIYK